MTNATTPILATKLYAPPPRPNLVPRRRLVERLNEGVRLGRRLTLVSAPAGFGKTSLVAEWLAAKERPVAWVSLDAADDDPIRFLGHVVAALQQIAGDVGSSLRELIATPRGLPAPALLASLVNDLAALPPDRPLTLVLDDYHAITAPPVHEMLQFLVANQPATLHLVVGTREDPPLPLPLLRVRGQLTELRERDLRFTTDEAAEFLRRTMGLDVDARAVATLEARTEGWVAGLQLAALALQNELRQNERQNESPSHAADVEAFVAAFAGCDRYVFDYLATEVIERQPPAVRDFLRQTAILDRLCAPLCDALSGRSDGQAMLESLQAANLFVLPLDRRREWYRYHHLFADVLRVSLDRDERRRLHERAAEWFAQRELTDEAVRHALAAAEISGDYAVAERLIVRNAEATLQRGGISTLAGWLAALPAARRQESSKLAVYSGLTAIFRGEAPAAESYVAAAERLLGPDRSFPSIDPTGPTERGVDGEGRDPLSRSLVHLLRGLVAMARRDNAGVVEPLVVAADLCGDDRPQWKLLILWALAEAQERTGNITAAIASLTRAARIGRALGTQIFVVLVETSLASALNHHCERRRAVAVCEAAFGRHAGTAERPSSLASLICSRLAELAYEANLIDRACELVAAADERLRHLPLPSIEAYCLATAACIAQARGDGEGALDLFGRARRLAVEASLDDATWIAAGEFSLRLRRGDLDSARLWAESAGLQAEDSPDYLDFEQYLAFARLLIAEDRLTDARRLLDRMARTAAERELRRYLLTVRILQAHAAERAGDRSIARERLAEALQLAVPGDYIRAFLDEDPVVVGLLPEVRAAAAAFVDRVLAAAGVPNLANLARPRAPQSLAEPLTEREVEVLGLIASGLSNDEIGEKLVIATGTVKRHINHIYGKLDVGSRTQAIAKARALRLL